MKTNDAPLEPGTYRIEQSLLGPDWREEIVRSAGRALDKELSFGNEVRREPLDQHDTAIATDVLNIS